jgi:hypothetical protein
VFPGQKGRYCSASRQFVFSFQHVYLIAAQANPQVRIAQNKMTFAKWAAIDLVRIFKRGYYRLVIARIEAATDFEVLLSFYSGLL